LYVFIIVTENTEYVFNLLETIDFAKDKGPVTNGFSWLDTEENKWFLFEIDNVGDNMNSLFSHTVARCMYEAKYKHSSEDSSEEELTKLIKYVNVSVYQSALNRYSSTGTAHAI
jgi:hypothetical protein